MHIIREKTDCNQKMKCGYLVPPKVWSTFFFYCSPRLIPIRESMLRIIQRAITYSAKIFGLDVEVTAPGASCNQRGEHILKKGP